MPTALLFAWGSTSVRHRKLQSSTVNNFLSAFGKSSLAFSHYKPELGSKVICDDTSPQGETMDDECSPLRSGRRMDFIITSLKGRMFYENVFNQ